MQRTRYNIHHKLVAADHEEAFQDHPQEGSDAPYETCRNGWVPCQR
jgi:hypothetical protein